MQKSHQRNVQRYEDHPSLAPHSATRSAVSVAHSTALALFDNPTGAANLLTDGRISIRRRYALATEIGANVGNFFLQRMIAQGKQDASDRVWIQRQHDAGAPAGVPEASPIAVESGVSDAIPAELQTSVDLESLGDTELRNRQALIGQTLLFRMESSPATRLLEQEAVRIRHVLAERRVEAAVQTELEGFLTAFSNISVTVRWVENTQTQCVERSRQVSVHPPYFMNVPNRADAEVRTLERYDVAMTHRRAAERATVRFLRGIGQTPRRGGMGLARATAGKAHPEDIQHILQSALDQNVIQPQAGPLRPNSEDLRNWLIRYGIGVDCSAFVSQALNRATEHIQGQPLESHEQLNRGSRELRGGARGFTVIRDPQQLRPGDTMQIPGHIRIVTSAGRNTDGEFSFSTAESRSGGRADVGPDRAEWRYYNRRLQVRRSPGDQWSDTGESPTFGRYNRLQEAMQGAATQ